MFHHPPIYSILYNAEFKLSYYKFLIIHNEWLAQYLIDFRGHSSNCKKWALDDGQICPTVYNRTQRYTCYSRGTIVSHGYSEIQYTDKYIPAAAVVSWCHILCIHDGYTFHICEICLNRNRKIYLKYQNGTWATLQFEKSIKLTFGDIISNVQIMHFWICSLYSEGNQQLPLTTSSNRTNRQLKRDIVKHYSPNEISGKSHLFWI